MPRIAAIDWDRYEARLVVARTLGKRVRIEAVAAVPLESPEGALPGPAEVGAALQPLLAEHRASRATVLVAVDRASVEMLSLRLPPATDAELPVLVANEVLRESQAISDQAVVDFLPLDDNPAEARRVSAAVLSAERLRQVRETCRTAGAVPQHLVLRSFAAASLLSRALPAAPETCLLVSPSGEEVDMTILVQGRPVYWRTARLPRAAAAEELAERLTQEIRRTLAVAGQDIQPPVERVCLFARDSAHALLRDRIKHDLGLPAEPLNPFAAVEIEAELVPEHAGRFAAALGMVLDQAHGVRHAMDFLHPRRAPRQMTRAKFAAIGAAAVLTIAALLGNMFWRQRGELDSVIAELTAELKEYDGITSQVGQQRRVTDALLNWQAGDIYWLEELRELSERFPPAEESVILRMSISASPDGGHIALQGMMRDPAQIARMELALRDAHHGIRSRRIQEGARQDQQYKCLFDAAIAVAKRTREQYLPEQGRKP